MSVFRPDPRAAWPSWLDRLVRHASAASSRSDPSANSQPPVPGTPT
ncbi:MAG: hypothetical protein R2752_20675 [Vicinamibacterales bacterium]